MNFRIITKNHAADSKIGFSQKIDFRADGTHEPNPTAWELIINLQHRWAYFRLCQCHVLGSRAPSKRFQSEHQPKADCFFLIIIFFMFIRAKLCYFFAQNIICFFCEHHSWHFIFHKFYIIIAICCAREKHFSQILRKNFVFLTKNIFIFISLMATQLEKFKRAGRVQLFVYGEVYIRFLLLDFILYFWDLKFQNFENKSEPVQRE